MNFAAKSTATRSNHSALFANCRNANFRVANHLEPDVNLVSEGDETGEVVQDLTVFVETLLLLFRFIGSNSFWG